MAITVRSRAQRGNSRRPYTPRIPWLKRPSYACALVHRQVNRHHLREEYAMNIDRWKPADKLEFETGSVVQVLGKTADRKALKVPYVDAPFEPEKLGTEADEDGLFIIGILSADLTSTHSDDLQSTTDKQSYIN
jgi:hypothetical protein